MRQCILLCICVALIVILLPLESSSAQQSKQQQQKQQQQPEKQEQKEYMPLPDAEDDSEVLPHAESLDDEADIEDEHEEQQQQQPPPPPQQKQEESQAELQARIQSMIDQAVQKHQERQQFKKHQQQQQQQQQQQKQQQQKQQQQQEKDKKNSEPEGIDIAVVRLSATETPLFDKEPTDEPLPEAQSPEPDAGASTGSNSASNAAESPVATANAKPDGDAAGEKKFMTEDEVREQFHSAQNDRPRQKLFAQQHASAAEERVRVADTAEEISKHAQQLFDDGQRILNATRSPTQTGLINKAFQYISQAAALNHTKAMELTALAHLFGEGVSLDLIEAERLFRRLADLGNPRGQLGLAFLHTHALTQSEAASPGRALLYLTFSAIGGDPFGQMALAYRYWAGVGVETSCETALLYYQQVAKLVADKVKPWTSPVVLRIRLLDDEAASNGQTGALDDDLIQYYQFLADKGDVNAQVGLGQLYFQGGRGVPVNHQLAFNYFKLASQAGNANAMAYLGKMYAGDSSAVMPDNKTALQYFTKAAQSGNAIGYAGLGLMHLQGRGVPASPQKAEEFFSRSAELGYAEGQLQLGLMYYAGATVAGVRDLKKALKYFTLASQQGNTLAFYYLAQMHAAGSGVLRSCQTAAELYKNVAERGRWSDQLMEAHRLFKEEASAYGALLRYLFLADAGYEVAQSNAAFILDQNPKAFFPMNESYARARQLWSRAAGQSYAQARLKLADYHYYGLGGPVNLEQAASLYRAASEQQSNAQAMFNLAYMYQQGLGLERDLHLAKRYYDQAAEASPDAYMPVMLALVRLAAEFVLDYLRGGHYSLSDLASLLSFSNFWPTVNHQQQQQQQPPSQQHHEGANEEFSPDSEEHHRQHQLAAATRSWDSLLLTVLIGLFVYLLIRLLNRAANRREAGAANQAPAQDRNN